MEYRVLVVEDDRAISGFLQMELAHEGCKVETAFDGRQALELALGGQYDIILLDIMIPYINGVEVCKRIREKSAVPIIMLTAKSDVSDKVLGLDTGANDYLTKPFEIEELFARMRAVTRTAAPVESDRLTCKNVVMDRVRHTVEVNEKEVALTKREFDLLEQFLLNKDIVLTRDRLLQNVWEFDYIGDSNVVDVTIRHLRAKLGDKDGEIISTVRGFGYITREKTNG